MNESLRRYGEIIALSIPEISVSREDYNITLIYGDDENSEYIKLEAGLYEGESLELIKDIFEEYIVEPESYQPFVAWTEDYVITSDEFYNGTRLYRVSRRNPISIY